MTHRLFDRYVFVDWSANATPKRGRDSIWYATDTAETVSRPENPATRYQATRQVQAMLREAAARNERVLIGFDFPYGYPAGFAASLGRSTSEPAWRTTWSRLRDRIGDSATNANTRFLDAASLNRAIGGPPGPFWGHPQAFADDSLVWKTSFPFQTGTGQLLRELRHTERHLRAVKRMALPVWKLAGQGAVGSQALLGIPRVAGLRDDAELADFSRVWPFETGFDVGLVPDRGPFVLHAEIWPGVLDPDPAAHVVADARQVMALVEWARRLDEIGDLGREFAAPPLAARELEECIREEGWILGATTAAPRALR